MSLYGDLSGAQGMNQHFPTGTGRPVPPWNPQDGVHWLRSLVTYLWLPSEYYRNLVEPPLLLKALVGVFMATGVAGWLTRSGGKGDGYDPSAGTAARTFLAVQYLACLGVYTWAFNSPTLRMIPARITLPTLTCSAVLICGGGMAAAGCGKAAGRLFAGSLCVFLLGVNTWVLWSVRRLPLLPFHLFT